MTTVCGLLYRSPTLRTIYDIDSDMNYGIIDNAELLLEGDHPEFEVSKKRTKRRIDSLSAPSNLKT